MKLGSFTLTALTALYATTLFAQENSILMEGGPSWKGLAIRFAPKVEPDPNGVSKDLGGTVIDLLGGVVGQRFIDDRVHKRSFGYDVHLEPGADGGSARIRIEPLHAADHAVKSGWTEFGLPTGLPKYPVISSLRIGDTVVLDLLVNPSTGQKIADYLTLIRPAAASEHDAHDFSLTDIQLSLDRPHVLVNGKAIGVADSGQITAGPSVWIYLKGHGRYVLSLFPNEKLGSRKNGTADGDTLIFLAGPDEVRVRCDGPVTPGRGTYNLYVIQEPQWRPPSASQTAAFGSSVN